MGGLEQGYVVCPSDKRFLLLFTFLKRNKNKKIMVCDHDTLKRPLALGPCQPV